jgi:hypothetical protein
VTYKWAAEHKPRKPRYYNRVMLQYEWNKYNQAHYDKDNPPPKSAQGYKFNVRARGREGAVPRADCMAPRQIFYPDLVDPYHTPEYKITPHASNPDLCVITFKGGAPYTDLAFTIFNREWERSDRSGFRCSFERGVFRLYFNFRRMRYRR